eukprot:gb/GFBE01047666.1/.p1 GENE.gb/GFBE01047666.1/~~gb/GFBE01047666.1/.p1  ORF type:complete len:190 (+),score=11.71 gb/GFBE01047666.1/:1-570(+)
MNDGGDSRGRTPVGPPAQTCNCTSHCDPTLLDGHFGGNVSTSKRILGRTVHVNYYMSHRFDAKKGTVDVALTPYQSPFGMLQSFQCLGVPIRLDRQACHVTVEDDCIRRANSRNYVTSMQYAWDGMDALTVYETLHTPVFSQNYIWKELPGCCCGKFCLVRGWEGHSICWEVLMVRGALWLIQATPTNN